MSLYSIDKLINETRRIAAEFRRTTGTILPVSGEIARYDVSRYLDLTLCNEHNAGFDAIGKQQRQGQKVLIKSRIITDSIKSGHRLGQINPNASWDIVILALMDNTFEPYEMYQLSRDQVIDCASGNNKKNITISVAKFKAIGDLVWTSNQDIIYSDNKDISNEYYNEPVVHSEYV